MSQNPGLDVLHGPSFALLIKKKRSNSPKMMREMCSDRFSKTKSNWGNAINKEGVYKKFNGLTCLYKA